MRVNLIHSILVFWEKNIVYITVNLIHFKLVFLKKQMLKNLTHWKKKKPWTVQENCTVHVNSAIPPWTVQVNCTVHWWTMQFSCTVHANCTVHTVHWTVQLACIVTKNMNSLHSECKNVWDQWIVTCFFSLLNSYKLYFN